MAGNAGEPTTGRPPTGHDRSRKPDDEEDDEDDPVEKMLKKAGCLEEHYQVQNCMFENKDWTQCQNEVQIFRECIEKSKSKMKK